MDWSYYLQTMVVAGIRQAKWFDYMNKLGKLIKQHWTQFMLSLSRIIDEYL